MGTLITILIVLVCILLILVVLIQNPKGGGIASGFQAANQIIGVKQSTDVVEKATWYLAIALVVLSLFGAPFMKGSGAVDTNDEIETTVPVNLPGGATPMPMAPPANNGGGQPQN